MKLFYTTSLIAIMSLTTFAQGIDFGVSAGYINSTSKISGNNTVDITSDAVSGFYAGLLAEISLIGIIKVQPELLYANVDDTSFIQVPLMVKVYPIPKVYIQAGPQFTYILEDVLDDFSKLNTGAAIGAGVDIAFGLFAQARYVFQLNNNYTGPADINLRANSLQAGIGYKF